MTHLINDYDKKVLEKKQFEEQVIKYKISKPKPELNKWKYTNPHGKVLSEYPADKVYSYKIPIKEKLTNQKPFLRPSEYGNNFNEIDLSCEFDKFGK
jgi:hypothetical protein